MRNNFVIIKFTCCKRLGGRLNIGPIDGAVGWVTEDGVYQFVDIEVLGVIDSWTVHHLYVTGPKTTAVTFACVAHTCTVTGPGLAATHKQTSWLC